jgi:hypothetical protein
MSANLPHLLNAMDSSIATIKRLSEISPALDDGGSLYFPHRIELLVLIAQQASHLERLSGQLTRCVLPRPRRGEEDQP